MLLKRKPHGGGKHFCKGVVLSSFLTAVLAGVSSPSFAEQLPSTGPITSGNYEHTGNITVSSDSSVIDTTGDAGGSVTINISASDSENGNLDLDGVKEEGHTIWSELDANEEIKITAAGDVTIKAQGTNSGDNGDGINVTSGNKGSITVTADGSNTIIAESKQADGIYTAEGSSGDVKLVSNGVSSDIGNIVNVENNGIDHRGSQIVTLEAENGVNRIKTESGDGLRNTGTGTITLTASSNELVTGDNGVQVGGENSPVSGIVTILANNGSNKIEAGSNGIELTQDAANTSVSVSANGYNSIQGQVDGVKLAGSGTVSVTASASVIEGSTINLLSNDEFYTDDEIPYNNYFIGGENGIHRVENSEAIFNAKSDNNNYISGGTNGILAEGVADSGETPSILITANNGSNIIGYETFKDENGETHSGQIGENGINVTSGSVSLVAGDSNIIKATHKGVSVSGEQSSVSLIGGSNSITVKDSVGKQISGLFVDDKGKLGINSIGEDINIDIDTVGTLAYGINVGDIIGGGEIALEADSGNVIIDVTTGAPNATKGNVSGIEVQNKSKATISAGKNIIISTDSQMVEQSNGANDVSNIRAQYGSEIIAEAFGYFKSFSEDKNGNVVGFRSQDDSSIIKVISHDKDEFGYGIISSVSGKTVNGVLSQDGSTYLTSKNGGVYISASGKEAATAINSAAITVDVQVNIESNGDIFLSAQNSSDVYLNANYVSGIFSNSYNGNASNVEITGKNINIITESVNNNIYGVYAYNNSSSLDNNVIDIYGENVTISSNTDSAHSTYGIYSSLSTIDMSDVSQNINITANSASRSYGIYNNTGKVVLSSKNGFIDISSTGYAVYSQNNSIVDLSAISNLLTGKEEGIRSFDSNVTLTALSGNNSIQGNNYGVYALTWFSSIYNSNTISLNAKNNLITTTTGTGIFADSSKGLYSDGSGTLVELNASVDNTIRGGEIYTVDGVDFAKNYAIQSLNGSSVTLEAGNQNSLFGAVYAEGAEATVTLNADINYVASYAQSSTLGDLNTDDAFKDKSVISALYAEEGANISLTGNSNVLRTYAEYDNEYQLERVVWAYNGTTKGTSISIDGYSYIATDSYDKSPNSLDIAIAAGTGVELTPDKVNEAVADEDRAKVSLTYADTVDEEGNTVHSYISGDILSAYEGLVDITPQSGSNAGININGNLLAGNNGILNVNLGNGGILTGRADDYGDAGVISEQGHADSEFFDPAFSSAIYKGGEVNLTMGEGSRWNVTGQSWITRINTENSSNAIIDLISDNTDRNSTAHALTVYELTGNAIFNMSLDADRNVSDMLYIKNADGNYTVNVIDAVSQDDMYAGGLDGLRFATVGTGSNASFRAITYNGGGINNIEYRVGTDAYTGNDENVVYNGDGMTEHKPGDDTVDGFFESDGEPGATTPATQAVSLAAVSPLAEESTTTAADSGLEEVTNFKLIGG